MSQGQAVGSTSDALWLNATTGTAANIGCIPPGTYTTSAVSTPVCGWTTTTVPSALIDPEALLKDRVFRAAILKQIRRAFKTAWTCPRCQRIYAPSHQHCEVCNIIDRLEGR